MTNEELGELLNSHSEEWVDGFLSAINLNSQMKSAFLRGMIGETVLLQDELRPQAQ